MNWRPGGGPCCGRSEPQVRPLECELQARLCSFLPRGTQNKHCSQTSRGWGSGMASHICNPSTQEVPASKTNPSAQGRQIQGVSRWSGATKQPLPPRPSLGLVHCHLQRPTAASWGFPASTSPWATEGPTLHRPHPPLLSASQGSFLTDPVSQDLPPCAQVLPPSPYCAWADAQSTVSASPHSDLLFTD